MFLVSLGGFVRATGAGLSCPDWPLCYGQVVPSMMQPGVAQEYAHRVTAGSVSCLSLVLFALAFRRRREFPRLWQLCIVLFVVLGIQVVFGGLTVLMKLRPFVVTTHLALGTLFFVLMGLIALEIPRHSNGPSIQSERTSGSKMLLALTVLVALQVILGGLVGSSGASLACLDIPFCNGMLFPDDATYNQIVQMAHRLLGTGILLIALGVPVPDGAVRTKQENDLPPA